GAVTRDPSPELKQAASPRKSTGLIARSFELLTEAAHQRSAECVFAPAAEHNFDHGFTVGLGEFSSERSKSRAVAERSWTEGESALRRAGRASAVRAAE